MRARVIREQAANKKHLAWADFSFSSLFLIHETKKGNYFLYSKSCKVRPEELKTKNAAHADHKGHFASIIGGGGGGAPQYPEQRRNYTCILLRLKKEKKVKK